MKYIGIDIGTSSICGVVAEYRNQVLDSITLENNTNIKSLKTWEKVQDPEKILSLAAEIINTFCSRYNDIKGIGVTGQMHGILYVDQNGNSLSPLFTWQDGRGNEMYSNDKTYSQLLSESSGYSLSAGYGLMTHFYNLQNKLVPEGASKICTIMDYVVMKLTGGKSPKTDSTNAAALGFFDLQNLKFDKDALNACGILADILPELVQSAQLTGTYKNIPVYSAIGDNQASFLGSVNDIPNSVHITVGTSGQISVYSDKYLKIDNLDTRPFPGGGYILVGASLCGGKSFEILKDFFADTLKLFVPDFSGKIDFYEIMTSIDFSKMERDEPIVESTFQGSRAMPLKRASITHLSENNFTPEYLITAFMKAIARELYDFFCLIPEELRNRKKILVGSGNAIRMNKLLRMAIAHQFNKNLTNSIHHEEAAYGATVAITSNIG